MDWDADESYLLAKIAMAEAEGEGVEGKAMVIMVVLNRVWAEGFPGTIEDVIFEYSEEKDIYQFSPVAPGGRWWTTEPDEECWEALRLIMVEKWDESEGALYFEATYNGEETWHSKNLEYIKTVGNHNFYK
nr:MAG TPA: Cell Wall Hydrolase [Caudoviricetes sp.]